jgi:predicted glycoside hydrolase/deacetylase ChbG (UPF0249 family)
MEKNRKFNRRDFLRIGGLAAGGLTAAQYLRYSNSSIPEGSAVGHAVEPDLMDPAGGLMSTQPYTPIDVPFPQETTLKPNPLLKKLGFNDDDRVIIPHVDDIGMCQASVEAFADLVDFGLVSSGSVMVPCAWFPLAAHYARTHPEADIGVHLVLTSEWQSIRWRPVSTADPASGLIDKDGYFHNNGDEASMYAESDAAYKELETQILQAQNAGVDLTHADAHQFVAMYPSFLWSYLRLAKKYQLPPLFERKDREGWITKPDMPEDMVTFALILQKALSIFNYPLVDNYFMIPMEQPEYKLEITKQVLDAVPPGITLIIIHATKDTPELRAITPDWKGRVADYTTWMSEDLRDYIEELGLHIIGWRPIRNAMRD